MRLVARAEPFGGDFELPRKPKLAPLVGADLGDEGTGERSLFIPLDLIHVALEQGRSKSNVIGMLPGGSLEHRDPVGRILGSHLLDCRTHSASLSTAARISSSLRPSRTRTRSPRSMLSAFWATASALNVPTCSAGESSGIGPSGNWKASIGEGGVSAVAL